MDSEEWNRRYSGSGLVWTAEPNRFLVAEAGSLAPARALDVACGEGRNAVWLAERGWQVTGVDFAATGIDKARALAERRGVVIEWVVADLLDYRPPARTFELVLVFYLQVPADQRRTIIRALTAALASGGTLLAVAHDSSNLADGYGGPQDPAVLYTAQEVVSDLEGELVVERAERVERPVAAPDGEHLALDALVRARRP